MPEKDYRKSDNDKSGAEQYEDIITTHINADFDALASMIAARKLYPKAALVFPGSQEKNLRDFFLHSTSYIFNFVKIKQIDFDFVKRLILVDTRQKARIGKLSELLNRNDIEVHIYDHHPESEDDIHGRVEFLRKLGSCTAILTPLIKEKGIPITPDEATIMCLGIHEDTGSFTFSSTTAEDYMAASWLTEQGAKHNIISDMLTRELTAEQVWLLNDITKSATTSVINGVEVVITRVIREDYIGDVAVMVHKFMEMENLNVVFALAQMQDRIHIVARSRIEEVNVAEIALALGGGGHPQAASASVKDKTLAQVERLLRSLLRSRINPLKKAKDMMSSPVIHIGPDEHLKKATSLMTRYNINVLLVIDENGYLKGYLTRQVVEKAVFFGLEDIKAHEFMNIDFYTINPEAPLKEVQELIIRNKIRVLPVVDNEKVSGVITRTDLLNILLGEPLVPQFLYDSKSASNFTRKKNMAALLRERLPREINRHLKDLGQIADMLGYNVYLVGGLVRDVLLKIENLDVDIVVEGDGIKFAHEFVRHHKARVRSHRKFGTAVVIFPDGFKIDVATARMEYYEFPGAPPIVESSSLRMDLYRRDFAVNALAIKLNKNDYGVLIDYFGAQKDIKDRVLRVLHNLSFVEDPTRVFRAIRFEQRFGFKIGKLTLSLMKNAVKLNCFKDVSGRRLLLELKLILKEQDPIGAIRRMNEFDLLQFISPHIEFNDKVNQLLEETKKVIAWYNLIYAEEPFEPWKVYWYAITSSLDNEAIKSLSENMGMNDVEGRRIISQRLEFDGLVESLFRFSGDNYQLYSLLDPFDTESLLYIMAKAGNERIKRGISLYFTQLKGIKVEITGKYLSAMGFKPGPIFKDIFDGLLEARLNNLVKSREDEVRFVKDNFPRPEKINTELENDKKKNC
ncbi:MAG: CBS domain-containing protein [Deltaproteobacteria bacterium]|nr:CBS domain-containing protein [Deltaproteobacteria bacterium]